MRPLLLSCITFIAISMMACVPGTQLPRGDASRMMYTLLNGSRSSVRSTLDTLSFSGDTRFAAVLIELLRASETGRARNIDIPTLVRTLEALSHKSFGSNWAAWVEWYGATDLVPPPGFTSWKGRLFSRIDIRMGQFLSGDVTPRIRVEEILWGGVKVDGIPALDRPPLLRASDAVYLNDDDTVFGVGVGGQFRAYPQRIVDWHEMVNDTLGGKPISLAYCTLCGAAIVYSGLASDGNVYDFGSSGLLYRSNKLMYDRQTHSLWSHITGIAVLGPGAADSVSLTMLPVVLTTWAKWKEQHPETKVLDIRTGYRRNYATGAAYGGYFASPSTMFPIWQVSSLLPAKKQIYALEINGSPKAYPLNLLAEKGVTNDSLGARAIVLVAPGNLLRVEGRDRSSKQVTWFAGAEVRVYDRGSLRFRTSPVQETVLDHRDTVWNVTEEALVNSDGDSLHRIAGHLAYWFGWYSFYPNTLLYAGSSSEQ